MIHVLMGVLPAWQQNGLAMSQGWERRIDNGREMPRRQATRNANCAGQRRKNLNERPHLPLLLVFFFHSRNVLVATRCAGSKGTPVGIDLVVDRVAGCAQT
ncbi:hypothetical protein [Burkholderia sp. WSM2232]|uniref:hypothetical protein n=1 Tax=Burkholderia sp. WSM2232 TaxID=944436 RepID=UPI0012EB7D06|nr:hypothetical protein [Burkholderia sp. WSM2232]